MCTAVGYTAGHFYFGRTLDHDRSYGEKIAVTPRNAPLIFRQQQPSAHHYAFIGMAYPAAQTPLYYDAVNEKGLAAAGLNFPESAHYHPADKEKCNIASFELIPKILGQCGNILEAKALLQNANITDAAFSDQLPPTPLHWLIADRTGAFVVESTADGLSLYDDPAGVLTNEPPFPMQMWHLRNYLSLSASQPENAFKGLPLAPYSLGMGGIGLPGDLSSASRFVRAAFMRANAAAGKTEAEDIEQFFHILDSVAMVKGAVRTENDRYESTLYSCCIDTDRGIYYYTTCSNRRITGIDLYREDLNGKTPVYYPLSDRPDICIQN